MRKSTGLIRAQCLPARVLQSFLELGCKCSSLVLPSMVSFDLQCCTGNEQRLSANRKGVYGSSFDGELRHPVLYRKRVTSIC